MCGRSRIVQFKDRSNDLSHLQPLLPPELVQWVDLLPQFTKSPLRWTQRKASCASGNCGAYLSTWVLHTRDLFVSWAFLLCSPNNLKSGETILEGWFYTSLSLGFFQLIGKQCVIFLCRGCTQLGNELFIIRLCTYVEICIVSRSYGTVSWQRLVGNLGILRISNYLAWLVGICRPLLVYTLACWCWHLPKIKGIFRSGLFHRIDKEARGWYVREEKQISLSSFFLPGFPSLHTSNHYFPSFFHFKIIISLLFRHFISNLLASFLSHSVTSLFTG